MSKNIGGLCIRAVKSKERRDTDQLFPELVVSRVPSNKK